MVERSPTFNQFQTLENAFKKRRSAFFFEEEVNYVDDYVIEMNEIRKEFPGIVANDNITLQVKKR